MSTELRIDLDRELNYKTKSLLKLLSGVWDEDPIEYPQESEDDDDGTESISIMGFIQLLSSLVGPQAAKRIMEVSQDETLNILPYIAGVPNALLVDADPERTAETIAKEAHDRVYEMVKEMMKDED